MKVLIGISGGVDSFFSIELLQLRNYKISLLTFKNWSLEENSDKIENIVRRISEYFGLEYRFIDYQEIFYDRIVCKFVDSYFRGKTPNPCIECNRHIKFNILYDIALNENFDYIATGHYAKIDKKNGRFFIKKGIDENKDQSYFLWKLPQEYISKTIFPLGDYKKDEVKKICNEKYNGKKLFLENESEDICFLKNIKYADLAEKIKGIKSKKKWNYIYRGEKIGESDCYPFFTIGQRSGINVALGFPVYVLKIDSINNNIYLGKEKELYSDCMIVSELNFQKYISIKNGFECNVKIRYKSIWHKCVVNIKNNKAYVKFHEPTRAITPGQSAVFYEGDDIVFGGIIE